MLDLSRFEYLTFDCYGTLIDWETGILAGLRRILEAHRKRPSDAEILAAYAELEGAIEAGPYRRYRQVLEEVVRGMGRRFGFSPTDAQVKAFPDTIRDWAPFPDTVDALKRLATRYKLVVISNIDDDLFAHSARKLQVRLHAVITAEQAQSYKPSLNNFQRAMERLGARPEQILHCAESRFHDIAPARQLGIASVWVNRHAARPGPSASGQADAVPDVEVPDMKSLADAAGL